MSFDITIAIEDGLESKSGVGCAKEIGSLPQSQPNAVSFIINTLPISMLNLLNEKKTRKIAQNPKSLK